MATRTRPAVASSVEPLAAGEERDWDAFLEEGVLVEHLGCDHEYLVKRETWVDNQAGVHRYFTQVNEDSLLDSTPEELRTRFPHFFVAPHGALRSRPLS